MVCRDVDHLLQVVRLSSVKLIPIPTNIIASSSHSHEIFLNMSIPTGISWQRWESLVFHGHLYNNNYTVKCLILNHDA